MSAHFIKKFILICISLTGVSYTDSSSRYCKVKERYLKGTNTPVRDLTFGDCRFEHTLCHYTQGYKDDNANNWTVFNGSAVCPGKCGDQSYSVLLSPLLNIPQNTSIMFNYSQQLPGRLSVFLVSAANKTTQVMPCKDSENGPFHEIFHLNESIAKIAFVAVMANAKNNVTLNYVKVQAGPNTTLPNHTTSTGKSLSYSQPATKLSTREDNPEAAEVKGGNNAAIVAGVIVPVIVMVAVVVVGVFIWRHRRQRLHGNPKETLARQDARNTPPCASETVSSNKSSPNGPEHSGNTKSKSVHGVLDNSRSHYDTPRRPSARVSRSAGDDYDHNYNILEEHSTPAAPQTATGVLYSYARGIGRDPCQSNNAEADYNRIGSAEASSREQGEDSYDVVEDDYSHISSTDAVGGVGSQAAASRLTGWNGHPGQNLTAGGGDSDCDQRTSQECEDGYSVLSAGNKQVKAFNDQRSEGAEKEYGHLASNVHGDYDRIRRNDRDDVLGNDNNHVGGHTEGDYDRIRRKDRDDVLGNDYNHVGGHTEGDYDRIRCKDRDDVMGNDYDHVGGHTEGDYDEMGLTDKKIVIGNDYDHLV